jgi:hypothetical protein
MDEIAQAGRLRCGGLYEVLMGTRTLMRTDGTSCDEVDGAFKRVMPSPFWNQRARAQPERAGTDLSKIGESNFGVTCDSNDLRKTATDAFQQEVVSRIVTDAESQHGTTGDAKGVLTFESSSNTPSA